VRGQEIVIASNGLEMLKKKERSRREKSKTRRVGLGTRVENDALHERREALFKPMRYLLRFGAR
jgi:hypothetical protein